jgi:hypothetical protein
MGPFAIMGGDHEIRTDVEFMISVRGGFIRLGADAKVLVET